MTYRYGNTVICRWAAEDEIGRIEKRNVLNRVKMGPSFKAKYLLRDIQQEN